MRSCHRHFRYDVIQSSDRETPICSNCFFCSSEMDIRDHKCFILTCSIFLRNIIPFRENTKTFRNILSIHNVSVHLENWRWILDRLKCMIHVLWLMSGKTITGWACSRTDCVWWIPFRQVICSYWRSCECGSHGNSWELKISTYSMNLVTNFSVSFLQ